MQSNTYPTRHSLAAHGAAVIAMMVWGLVNLAPASARAESDWEPADPDAAPPVQTIGTNPDCKVKRKTIAVVEIDKRELARLTPEQQKYMTDALMNAVVGKAKPFGFNIYSPADIKRRFGTQFVRSCDEQPGGGRTATIAGDLRKACLLQIACELRAEYVVAGSFRDLGLDDARRYSVSLVAYETRHGVAGLENAEAAGVSTLLDRVVERAPLLVESAIVRPITLRRRAAVGMLASGTAITLASWIVPTLLANEYAELGAGEPQETYDQAYNDATLAVKLQPFGYGVGGLLIGVSVPLFVW